MDYKVSVSDDIDTFYNFFADSEDSARQLYQIVKESGLYVYVALYNVVQHEELMEDWGEDEEAQ